MLSDLVGLFVLARVRSPNFDELILRCCDDGIVVLYQCKVADPVGVGKVLCAEFGGVAGLGRIGRSRVGRGGARLARQIQIQIPRAENAVTTSRIAAVCVRLGCAEKVDGCARGNRDLRFPNGGGTSKAYRMDLWRSMARPLTPLICPPACLSARSRTTIQASDRSET